MFPILDNAALQPYYLTPEPPGFLETQERIRALETELQQLRSLQALHALLPQQSQDLEKRENEVALREREVARWQNKVGEVHRALDRRKRQISRRENARLEAFRRTNYDLVPADQSLVEFCLLHDRDRFLVIHHRGLYGPEARAVLDLNPASFNEQYGAQLAMARDELRLDPEGVAIAIKMTPEAFSAALAGPGHVIKALNLTGSEANAVLSMPPSEFEVMYGDQVRVGVLLSAQRDIIERDRIQQPGVVFNPWQPLTMARDSFYGRYAKRLWVIEALKLQDDAAVDLLLMTSELFKSRYHEKLDLLASLGISRETMRGPVQSAARPGGSSDSNDTATTPSATPTPTGALPLDGNNSRQTTTTSPTAAVVAATLTDGAQTALPALPSTAIAPAEAPANNNNDNSQDSRTRRTSPVDAAAQAALHRELGICVIKMTENDFLSRKGLCDLLEFGPNQTSAVMKMGPEAYALQYPPRKIQLIRALNVDLEVRRQLAQLSMPSFQATQYFLTELQPKEALMKKCKWSSESYGATSTTILANIKCEQIGQERVIEEVHFATLLSLLCPSSVAASTSALGADPVADALTTSPATTTNTIPASPQPQQPQANNTHINPHLRLSGLIDPTAGADPANPTATPTTPATVLGSSPGLFFGPWAEFRDKTPFAGPTGLPAPGTKLFFSTPSLCNGAWVQFYGPGFRWTELDSLFEFYLGSICHPNDKRDLVTRQVIPGTIWGQAKKTAHFEIAFKWESQ